MTAGFRLEWEFAGYAGTVENPEVTWREQSGLFASRSRVEASMRLRLPQVDVRSAVLSGGHSPESGVASLYHGDELLLAGQWRDVRMGEDRTLRLALASGDEDDRAVIPAETEIGRIQVDPEALTRRLGEYQGFSGRVLRVVEDAFTAASRVATGRVIPLVFGAPGDADHPGSPGLVVDTSSTPKKSACHAGRVRSTGTLLIWGPTAGATPSDPSDLTRVLSDTANITHTVDAFGRTIAVSDFGPGSSNVGYDAEGTYFYSWVNGEALPGGAGDVCMALLGASSLRWDVHAWDGLRAWLNGYTLAGFVDEAASPIEVLRRQVLPLLPLSMVPGPRGLRPALYPWVAHQSGRGRSFTVDQGFAIASDVQRAPLEPELEVRLAYGWNPMDRAYSYEVSVGPGESSLSSAAVSRHGRSQRAGTIEARWLWDRSTAYRVARERVRTVADTPFVVSYSCDPGRFGVGGLEELHIGDVLRFSDSRIGVSNALAVVGEIERTNTAMRTSIYLQL
jgi:hypothetical protein